MSLERQKGPEEDAGLTTLPTTTTRQPRQFVVILHNDDYTTMEFVVTVLMRFFGKTETEANRVMLEVHYRGHGVAGTYSRDVAETKVEQVEELARTEGHPLRCTAEPVEGEGESDGRENH